MSITVSSSTASYFSPATLPQRDRRATAERRVPMKAKPSAEAEAESSWGRHALLTGVLGVVLGYTGVMAVLAQRAASSAEQTANLAMVQQPVAAVTVTAPLFDATPAVSAVAGTTGAAIAEAVAGAESYSEDAAGVPGATYREPPVVRSEPFAANVSVIK